MSIAAKFKQHPYLGLITFLAVFQAVGALMGFITSTGTDGWYQTLERSPLNPPDYMFGIAWTILYVFLAVYSWLMTYAPRTVRTRRILMLFAAHMALNWAWSPVFFVVHALFASYVIILILILTGLALIWMSWPVRRAGALLLVPYLLWLMFAAHLSWFIWTNNS